MNNTIVKKVLEGIQRVVTGGLNPAKSDDKPLTEDLKVILINDRGVIKVRQRGKWNLIDTSGRILCGEWYKKISTFDKTGKFIATRYDGTVDILDWNGEVCDKGVMVTRPDGTDEFISFKCSK